MSNSRLATHVNISPNTNTRNHKIDTITIHCMGGNLTVESCGKMFATNKKSSSNYGVDTLGKIGMYAEEHKRSWCTSSPSNDNRAITIEVANNGGVETGWRVSDMAIISLILLITDICERNNIKELKWQGDKGLIGKIDKQNMTVHRWFSNKDCPGAFLYKMHPFIVKNVNESLNKINRPIEPNTGYKVRINTNTLNVRSLPDAYSTIVTQVKQNEVYTIVGIKGDWGQLKSGIGWVNLNYTTVY